MLRPSATVNSFSFFSDACNSLLNYTKGQNTPHGAGQHPFGMKILDVSRRIKHLRGNDREGEGIAAAALSSHMSNDQVRLY